MKNMERVLTSIFYFSFFLGMFLLAYSLMEEQDDGPEYISIPKNQVKEVVVNGDTSRRIYFVQDSTSGIIWVGMAGKIVTRK